MDKYEQLPQGKSTAEAKSPKVKFNTHIVLLCFSTLVMCFMVGNLLSACLTSFSCEKFLPSPSYLGCFRGPDRVFITSCTLISLILPLFFASTYINFSHRFSETKKKTFMILSAIVCASLPLLSLTDEVISNSSFPTEYIYRFSSSTFVVCSIILTAIIVKELQILQVSLKPSEKKLFLLLKFKLVVIALLIIFDILQWKFALSDARGDVFNENMQAKTEWALFLLTLFLPTFLSKFFRESNITFSLKYEKQKKKPSELELTEIIS